MDLTENHGRLEEYRKRAREIVSQMTLEEKIFQTLYNAPAIERLGVKAYNWWNEALHGEHDARHKERYRHHREADDEGQPHAERARPVVECVQE